MAIHTEKSESNKWDNGPEGLNYENKWEYFSKLRKHVKQEFLKRLQKWHIRMFWNLLIWSSRAA